MVALKPEFTPSIEVNSTCTVAAVDELLATAIPLWMAPDPGTVELTSVYIRNARPGGCASTDAAETVTPLFEKEKMVNAAGAVLSSSGMMRTLPT